MRVLYLLLILEAFLQVADRPARAASFDCAAARSIRDHLICNTPSLSKADAALGNLYTAKRALLSSAGAKLLQDSERSWFNYTQTVCRLSLVAAAALPDDPITPADCLAEAYNDRLKALSQTRRVGPYRFVRVDTYNARISDNDADLAGPQAGKEPGFDIENTSYPQIDSPGRSALLEDWNRKAKAEAQSFIEDPAAHPGDNESGNEFGLVTKSLISIRRASYFYGHGAAHGMFAHGVWNAVLGRSLRDLTPADLFGAGQAWEPRFGDIALAALREHGWKLTGSAAVIDVQRVVINPISWFLQKDGLEVSFSSYDGGCYMCTPENTVISWSELEPVLHTDLVP